MNLVSRCRTRLAAVALRSGPYDGVAWTEG